MSEQTKQAMDEAIRAHVSDELHGRLCSGWALIGVGVDGDQVGNGGASYHYETMPGLAYHSGLGLAELLVRWYENDDLEDE